MAWLSLEKVMGAIFACEGQLSEGYGHAQEGVRGSYAQVWAVGKVMRWYGAG